MYEFVRGPLVWIAMIVFVVGSLGRVIHMLSLANKEKSVIPTVSAKFGLRSILHWIIPYNSQNMRMHPVMTITAFAFHICLLVTPLFVMGHAVLWEESWNISWASLSPHVADTMTFVVILGGVFFMGRRLFLPEVKHVTTWRDYVILLIVVGPFLTGLVAHHQLLPYRAMLILHIVSGALWLIVIPFTRLSHMLWFVFTRAYMGSEFGSVRHSRDW